MCNMKPISSMYPPHLDRQAFLANFLYATTLSLVFVQTHSTRICSINSAQRGPGIHKHFWPIVNELSKQFIAVNVTLADRYIWLCPMYTSIATKNPFCKRFGGSCIRSTFETGEFVKIIIITIIVIRIFNECPCCVCVVDVANVWHNIVQCVSCRGWELKREITENVSHVAERWEDGGRARDFTAESVV